MRIIAFPHRPPKIGGPGSFQTRFEEGLKQRGWLIAYAGESCRPDVVFVVGGTRKLWWLLRCKLNSAKIVHRLDGVNWQHRVAWPGLRLWILAEIQNLLVFVIRRWFADFVVYQSQFVIDWWNFKFGETHKPSCIIFNGVDLNIFKPCYEELTKNEKIEEVVCVEGSVNGEPAIDMLMAIKQWIIRVYGNIANGLRNKISKLRPKNLFLMGAIERKKVPQILRGRKIFLNLDINAACPNSVIEALAAGVPVVGFDTGSLRELVGDDGGILLPYVTDPWKLESPVVNQLEPAIWQIFDRYDEYSRSARKRAECLFGMDTMLDKYLSVIASVLPENQGKDKQEVKHD